MDNIIDLMDKKLNSLGEWGKLGVLMIDPTGVTSYGDIKKAYNTYLKDDSLSNLALLGITSLGAIPIVGKIGKLAKLEKVASVVEPVEKVFQSTGRLKEFGAETVTKLISSAKATKDERLINLANIAKDSRTNHKAYPEEFVNYVDSILKLPLKKRVDTKTEKVLSSDGITSKKSLNTEFVFGENPETGQMLVMEIPKAPTTSRKIIHTKEFKDKNIFIRKAITNENLPEKSDDIDLALKALLDIEKGDFQVSEKMIQDIYSKSYGKMSNHLDEARNTHIARHEFNFVEYPQILMNLLTLKIGEVPTDVFEKASYDNIANLRNMFLKLELKQAGHTIVPVVLTPKGSSYGLTEMVVGKNFDFDSPFYQQIERKIYNSGYKLGVPPEKIKEAVENFRKKLTKDPKLTEQNTSVKFFPGLSVIAGAGDPYVVRYAFKNPVTGKLRAIPKLEEHHALALAEQMARAYIKNPKPINPEEMLNLYKGQREVDFLNRFLLLTKSQHTGTAGIHYADEFTLLDLGRIKNLSRMYKFNDLDDLLNYYRKIVDKRNSYFFKQGGILKYQNAGKFPVINKEGYLIDYINPIGVTLNGNVYDSNNKVYEIEKTLPETKITGYQSIWSKLAQEIGNGNKYWKEHPNEFWKTAKNVGKTSLEGAAVLTGNPWLLAADGTINLTSDNGIKKTIELENKEGVSKNTMLSALGDTANMAMIIPGIGEATKVGKNIYNFFKPLSKFDNSIESIYEATYPINRFRLGDVEINDPNLAYRLGPTVADNFTNSGKVNAPNRDMSLAYAEANEAKKTKGLTLVRLKPKEFNNPMFAQGRLWYGSPYDTNWIANNNQKQLLTTSEPLRVASKSSAPAKGYDDINGTVDVRTTDSDLNFGRRIQVNEGLLDTSNTTAYTWDPNYGFRKISELPSTYNLTVKYPIKLSTTGTSSYVPYDVNKVKQFELEDVSQRLLEEYPFLRRSIRRGDNLREPEIKNPSKLPPNEGGHFTPDETVVGDEGNVIAKSIHERGHNQRFEIGKDLYSEEDLIQIQKKLGKDGPVVGDIETLAFYKPYFTKNETELLKDAYGHSKIGIDPNDPNLKVFGTDSSHDFANNWYYNNTLLDEYAQTNRTIRNIISQETGLYGDELTEYIKRMGLEELGQYIIKEGSGYSKSLMKDEGFDYNSIKDALLEHVDNILGTYDFPIDKAEELSKLDYTTLSDKLKKTVDAYKKALSTFTLPKYLPKKFEEKKKALIGVAGTIPFLMSAKLIINKNNIQQKYKNGGKFTQFALKENLL